MHVYYGMASEKSATLSFTFWVKIERDDLYAGKEYESQEQAY
jgi:hypothetical protein